MANKIVGTSGDDVLKGTSKKDIIKGKGGNDVLIGKGGKDKLIGGDGDDTLKGGKGNDLLKGGSADDLLKGGGGDDLLLGGTDADNLFGGPGADIFKFKAGDGFHTSFPATENSDVFDDIIFGFQDGIDRFDALDPGWGAIGPTTQGAAVIYGEFPGILQGSFLIAGIDSDLILDDDFI